jgi:hypothetical protein
LLVKGIKARPRVDITADGDGIVGHAGALLLVELADRLGFTQALGWRAGRGQTRRHRHRAGGVLRDLVVMLADGGDCLSDLAVLRDQPELFGEVASTATAWRVLEQVAKTSGAWPGSGPPGRRPERGRGRPAPTEKGCCCLMWTPPW